MNKGALQCEVKAMVLGIENRQKKDGTPFRLVRFSDTAGNAQEAVDHDMDRAYAVFQPMTLTVMVKWGEWDGRAYVNQTITAAAPLNVNAMTGEVQ